MKIEIKNLYKNYGNHTAINGLNLTLEGNKIIGLLGKNGAGKTTLMRMLSGYFQSTSGEILINGKNPFNDLELMKQICFIEESQNFKEKFRIQDVLKVSSYYYPNWDNKKAKELLNLFKLDDRKKVKALSKGMYSALGIVVGLSSNAPITIFDEPYIGLDASFRSTFYDLLLKEYEENPRMFIFSTHLIDEVSQLFEEVVIIHDGELLLHEKTTDLVENHLLISGKKEVVSEFIKDKNVIHVTEMFGSKSAIIYGDQLNEEEAKALNLEVERSSVQDLFIHLTKEEVTHHVK